MDLHTTWLGLPLPHPIVVGASPLSDDLDMVRRVEDAGAAAIVMRSVFEEQIRRELGRTDEDIGSHVDAFAEASSFFPRPAEFHFAPGEYLEQLSRIKSAVAIPVVGSLNGVTDSGWLEYASAIEGAGADALELNVYYLATNPEETAEQVEQRAIDIVRRVKRSVKIPVAVKLSPFFSSLASFAARLEEAGADGLVLFNRFYQPDIDVTELEVKPQLHLSDPSELLLRLRWLAILSGQRRLDLAASGGVHSSLEAVKAIMAGAHIVQMVSALLRHGPAQLTATVEGLRGWANELGYASLQSMRGCMNLARCPDPAAFERGNYMRILQSWSD
jgi:dihydroorotate dehydrogenase (fumarate)